MNEPQTTVVELARMVDELERIADGVEDDEATYRFEEAIRHIEIGVGEWVSDAGESDAVGDRFASR